MISVERLREVLSYDAESGVFTWRDYQSVSGRYARNCRAGQVAGTLSKGTGYRVIFCDGKLYSAHRLAWFYTHGEWPAANIDHINMDRSDNRLSNLRLATGSQNNANRRARPGSVSGVKGAYLHKPSGRWYSRIGVGRKSIHLGYFTTKEEAGQAYLRAAEKAYGEFARAA